MSAEMGDDEVHARDLTGTGTVAPFFTRFFVQTGSGNC